MPRFPRLVLLALLTASFACSSGGTEPGPTPTISLALGTPAGTINQGASSLVSATLTRGGGYTGLVDLTVEGAPAGVTGSVINLTTSGTTTTGTVMITVAASVPVGTYPLTVRGTGTGVTPSIALFSLTVAPAPAFTLALSSGTLSVVQGGSDNVTVTLSRTNYADAVALTLEGAPTGVTGSFAPPSPIGTSSVLTVAVAASVAPGQYNLTVAGSGITNQSAPLVLTVTAAPSFGLSLTQPAMSVVQGDQGQTTVNITRTNFPGAVTLDVTGLPGGVTFQFSPASPTGASSVLTVTVGANVVPGVFPLSVTGTGSAGSHNTPLTLTVTAAAPSNNVTFNFSDCAANGRPSWLAFQDGNGAWTRVIGSADVYHFAIASGRGGVAWSAPQGFGSSLTVWYRTQAELTGGVVQVCPAATGRNITANFTNQVSGSLGLTAIGGVQSSISGSGLATYGGVADGPVDLVAMSRLVGTFGSNDVILLDRGLTPANGAALGPYSFTGPTAFAAVPVAMNATGVLGGETFSRNMYYVTGAACYLANLAGQFNSPTTFQQYGVPTGQQMPTDLHRLGLTTQGNGDTRIVTEDFHLLAPRTVAMPTPLPAFTVTVPTGGYKRLSTHLVAGAEYNGVATLFYSDQAGGGHQVTVSATPGWQQGAGTTLETPDLSAAAGWSNGFAPPAGLSVWSVKVTGSTGSAACGEGLRMVTASRVGTN